MGFVVRRYIFILTIIINFTYSTRISSFFGSSIPTSLFILKMFFRSFNLDYSASKDTALEHICFISRHVCLVSHILVFLSTCACIS